MFFMIKVSLVIPRAVRLNSDTAAFLAAVLATVAVTATDDGPAVAVAAAAFDAAGVFSIGTLAVLRP